MNDLKTIRLALAGKDTTELQVIAKRVKGLPWQTLYKVATGRSTNPTIGTVEKIMQALERAIQ